jgi:hypothetical protein
MLKRIALVLACTLAAAGVSMAQQIDEQAAAAACQNDAFRYCQAYVPDRERTLACLIRAKDEISPACRAMLASVIPPDPPARRKVRVKPKKPGGPIDLSPTAQR